MSSPADLRERITHKLVEALESGTPPWRRPWSAVVNSGTPANAVSGQNYTGINPLLLGLVAQERGYSSRFWGTFRQWSDLGCRVQARPANVPHGEWGTKVVFCKPAAKQSRSQNEVARDEEDRGYFLLREYVVFNAEQVEGYPVEQFLARPAEVREFGDFRPAELVIAATGADIRHGGNKSYYDPINDLIRLPTKSSFASQHDYYATAFHELVHRSGHPCRLHRFEGGFRFGTEAYALEELVAEIGEAYLCNQIGVPQASDLTNEKAYIASWIKILKGNASAIFRAASAASKAADYILAFSRKTQEPAEAICSSAGAA